jgi:esterase/lipase
MKFNRRLWLYVCAAATAIAACFYIYMCSGGFSRFAPAASAPSMRELIARQDYCARWVNPDSSKKPVAVALIVHGLNLRPEEMKPVIAILNSAGIEALNVSLCGHGENFMRRGSSPAEEKRDRMESFKHVSYFLWLTEVHQAYLKVMLRARKLGVPVFFVGYSLGGVLGCDLLTAKPGVHFDRMVLFAPALKLHPSISYQLRPLKPFPEFVIDSEAPEDQRANDGTPVAAYAALLEAIGDVEAHIGPKLNVPTLVFMDKEDEFVSFEQLQGFIHNNGLGRWEIAAAAKDNATDAAVAHHMILNEHSLGADRWNEVARLTIVHLLKSTAVLKPSPATPQRRYGSSYKR